MLSLFSVSSFWVSSCELFQRRRNPLRRLFTWTRRRVTSLILSIPTALSAVRSTCSLAWTSTGSTRRTLFRSRSQRAGGRSLTATIPNCEWRHGTGTKTVHGATQPIAVDTSRAARNLKIRSATYSLMLCRTAALPPAEIARCRVRTLLIGRAIRTSPANSRARATRCIHSGWWLTCGRRSQSTLFASTGRVLMPLGIRWNTGRARTRLILTRAPKANGKCFRPAH